MIEFALPLPCSVNAMYATYHGRRLLTKPARKWKNDARLCIVIAIGHLFKIPVFESFVSVKYDFIFPDNRRRDISNYIKQVEDAIVTARIIKDDSLVMAFSATKTVEKGKREVRVRIEEIK